jgi:outer membrane protein, multidrug efflux system
MMNLPCPIRRHWGGLNTRPLAGVALVLSLLAGCVAVGPDYSPPQPDVPAHWSTAAGGRATPQAELAQWWRQFNDPVLEGLVADALKANLDLATARAQLREARAQRELAAAGLSPSVDASVSASSSKSSAETGSGTSRNLYGAGFDASWEADVFGGTRRGVQAAQADLEASVASLHDVQVSLVAEVAVNYIGLRTAQRRLAIATSSLASLREAYDLARWRMQAGLASELDVAQARTELESAQATVPTLRTSVVEARHRLAVLLGLKPGELRARLGTAGAIPVLDHAVMVGIPADTLRQRPDVRVTERQLAAQTARLGEAEAARYPSFNLSGSIGLEALTLSGLGSGDAGTRSLLGSITAPIFDAGRIRANIAVQDAKLEQARLAYRSTVLKALEEVENALAGVANADERRLRLERAAASAQDTLLIARQRYSSGLTDFLSVLDSQRTMLNLEDELASSAGALATAQIQLYKALGGGWTPTSAPQDVGEMQ